ncbi:MAG: NAD kinase [Paludibacteraceae bacterium]|nr:NAD kinase [Paludibacteraceae bacterium]
MRVAIFGNNYKKENLALIESLFELLRKRGVKAYMEGGFYDFVKSHLEIDFNDVVKIDGDDVDADMAISIGGDGTFLKTASLVGSKEIPIIGINTGRLGFLADIASTDIVTPLNKILDGEYVVEEHSALELECGCDSKFDGRTVALNEIAVLKQDSSSMITIQTTLDGQHLVDYQADGLIIATPTGSTAYSMSNGGPLVMPNAHNIILTPVAPHSLTIRPLVVTDDSELRLKVVSRTNSFLCSVDGRSELFKECAELKIRKAKYVVKVVKQHEGSFLKTLKNKLMWGVDKRPSLK